MAKRSRGCRADTPPPPPSWLIFFILTNICRWYTWGKCYYCCYFSKRYRLYVGMYEYVLREWEHHLHSLALTLSLARYVFLALLLILGSEQLKLHRKTKAFSYEFDTRRDRCGGGQQRGCGGGVVWYCQLISVTAIFVDQLSFVVQWSWVQVLHEEISMSHFPQRGSLNSSMREQRVAKSATKSILVSPRRIMPTSERQRKKSAPSHPTTHPPTLVNRWAKWLPFTHLTAFSIDPVNSCELVVFVVGCRLASYRSIDRPIDSFARSLFVVCSIIN